MIMSIYRRFGQHHVSGPIVPAARTPTCRLHSAAVLLRLNFGFDLPYRVGVIAALALALVFPSGPAKAQRPLSNARVLTLADRYEELLRRAPRSGATLERWYGYLQQADLIESRIESLREEPLDGADGPRCRWLAGLLRERHGQPERALALLREAAEREPSSELWSAVGRVCQATARWTEACEAYQKAWDANDPDPSSADLLLALGESFYRTDQAGKAEELWQQADPLLEQLPAARRQVAQLMRRFGHRDAAIMQYEALLPQLGGEAEIEATLEIARLQQQLGRAQAAFDSRAGLVPKLRPGSPRRAEILDALEANTSHPDATARLRAFYRQQRPRAVEEWDLACRAAKLEAEYGDLAVAREQLEPWLARTPIPIPIRQASIVVSRRQGDWQEVFDQYQALCDAEPQQSRWRWDWVDAILASPRPLGDAKAAQVLRVLEPVAAGVPRQRRAAMTGKIAERLVAAGGRDAAESWLRQATSDEAATQADFRQLVTFYQEQARPEDAATVWLQAVERFPEDLELALAASEGLRAAGRFEAAATVLHDRWRTTDDYRLRFKIAEQLALCQATEPATRAFEAAEAIAEGFGQQSEAWQARIRLVMDDAQVAAETTRLLAAIDDADRSVETFWKAAALLNQQNRHDEAERVLEKGHAFAPEDLDLLKRWADTCEQSQHWQAAIDVLQRLVERDPRAARQVEQRIAELRMQMGDYERALQIDRRQLAAYPDDLELQMAHADRLFSIGRDRAAEAVLEEAAASHPENRDLAARLALHFNERWETDQAIEWAWRLWSASKTDWQREEALAALAPLYDRQLRFDAFLSELERRLQRDAVAAEEQRRLRALAYEAVGDPGRARQTLWPSLKTLPDDLALVDRLVGWARAGREDAVERRLLEHAVELSPQPSRRSAYRESLMRQRRVADLVTLAGQAAQQGRWGELKSIAVYFLRSSQPVIARRLYQQAVAQASGDAACRFDLAVLQWATEQREQVEATLTPLIEHPRPAIDVNSDPQAEAWQTAWTLVQMTAADDRDWLKWWAEQPATNRTAAGTLAVAMREIARQASADDAAATNRSASPRDLQTAEADVLRGLLLRRWVENVTEPEPERSEPANPADDRVLFDGLFRLAERGDRVANDFVWQILRRRSQQRQFAKKAAGLREDAIVEGELWRLNDEQLDWLRAHADGPVPDAFADRATQWPVVIIQELRAGGREAAAADRLQRYRTPERLNEFGEAALVLAAVGDREELLRLMKDLTGRLQRGEIGQRAAPQRYDQLLQQLAEAADPLGQWTRDERWRWLEAAIAVVAAKRQRFEGLDDRWRQVAGRVAVRELSQSYEIWPLIGTPLSRFALRLMHDPQIERTRAFQDRLREPSDAPEKHRVLREAIAAVQWTWGNQIDRGRAAAWLERTAAEFPEDSELQMTLALQLERVERRREALEVWRRLKGLPRKLEMIRQLAVLRLASYAGQAELATATARRLERMSLDEESRNIVTAQLKRLGLDRAAAELREVPGARRPRDPALQLETFWEDDRKQVAAEIAYVLLQRTAGRQRQSAANWLRRCGRLAAAEAVVEDRFSANPRMLSLGEALLAMAEQQGRSDRVLALRDQLQRLRRQRIQSSGDALIELELAIAAVAERSFVEAVEHFHHALALDPTALPPQRAAYVQAVQQSGQADRAFEVLAESDFSGWPVESIVELVDLDPQGVEQATAAGRRWMRHVLSTATAEQWPRLDAAFASSRRLGEAATPATRQALTRFFADTSGAELTTLLAAGRIRADGRYTGAVDRLVARADRDRDFAAWLVENLSVDAASPTARWQAETLRWLIRTDLNSEGESVAAPAPFEGPAMAVDRFAWQMAEALWAEKDGAGRVATAQAERYFQLARRSPAWTPQQRSLRGGLAGRYVAYLRSQSLPLRAREVLLEELGAAISASDREALRVTVADRLEQVGFSVDAAWLRGQELSEADLIGWWDQVAVPTFQSGAYPMLAPRRARPTDEPWIDMLPAAAIRAVAQRHGSREFQLPPVENESRDPGRLREAARVLNASRKLGWQVLTAAAKRSDAWAQPLEELELVMQELAPERLGLDSWGSLARIAMGSPESDVRQRGEALAVALVERTERTGRGGLPDRDWLLADLLSSPDEAVRTRATQELERLATDALRQLQELPRAAAIKRQRAAALLPRVALLREAGRNEVSRRLLERIVACVFQHDAAAAGPDPLAGVQEESASALQRRLRDQRQIRAEVAALVATMAPEAAAEWLWQRLVSTRTPESLWFDAIGGEGQADQEAFDAGPASLTIQWAVAAAAAGQTDQEVSRRLSRYPATPQTAMVLTRLAYRFARASSQAGSAEAIASAIDEAFSTGPKPLPTLEAIANRSTEPAGWVRTIRAVRQARQLRSTAAAWWTVLQAPSWESQGAAPRDAATLRLFGWVAEDPGACRLLARDALHWLQDKQISRRGAQEDLPVRAARRLKQLFTAVVE